MGQEQLRTGEGKKMQEKTPPQESDRAVVKGFDRRIQNNPAMEWGGKKSPLSKPT